MNVKRRFNKYKINKYKIKKEKVNTLKLFILIFKIQPLFLMNQKCKKKTEKKRSKYKVTSLIKNNIVKYV